MFAPDDGDLRREADVLVFQTPDTNRGSGIVEMKNRARKTRRLIGYF
jgi:hypothetical protein